MEWGSVVALNIRLSGKPSACDPLTLEIIVVPFVPAEFLIRGDVGDEGLVEALCREMRVDVAVHFAAYAYVGESVTNPRKYFQNNVEGGLALLNTAVDRGVLTFVFSSTCAVYGVPDKVPITEHEPRKPINPYGVSKLFLEHALEAYSRAYRVRFAALRYFNAAGAAADGSAWLDSIRKSAPIRSPPGTNVMGLRETVPGGGGRSRGDRVVDLTVREAPRWSLTGAASP